MAKKAEASLTIPKTEAVRKALQAGKEKPREGVAWIKQELGLDVTPEYFSTTKSALRSEGKPPSAPKGKGDVSGALVGLVDDLEVVRRLVHKYGKDEVRRLIEKMEGGR